MTKGEAAKEYFSSGYNCSQAVALAFCDEMDMPAKTVSRLTVGFGGGVGRMREVCGAVSGMTFVISALYDEEKTEIYKRVQAVADSFREQNGSIICRELLGLAQGENSGPVAEARTPEFYKKRPCGELVRIAADILADYIKANPYKK
jgi:C_GCAxxG_C_C family probable redox protein